MCEICKAWTDESLFFCHICSQVYHDDCLCCIGYQQNNSTMEVMDTAHTKMGWSCYLLHECLGWGTLGFGWVMDASQGAVALVDMSRVPCSLIWC